MKKFVSALLVVLMLAGISAFAFAAPSPSQDTGGGGYWIGDAPKADPKAAAKADAAKAESTAVKAITDAAAEDGTVALGKLPGNADAAMKADYEKLVDGLVSAKDALAKDEDAAIPADIKAAAEDSALVVAGQPFRAVASAYPATITIAVENPDDFVGLMVFVSGKWVKLNTVVNDDGTVTFVLDQPAVLSIVSQVVSAA